MKQFALFIAAFTAAMATGLCAVADTYGSAARTQEFTVASDKLGELREIYVRTPPRYDPEKDYPVVYVLDGEWNFEYVSAYLDYMADNEVYPDLIVTGVKNVNRNRDYVPHADPRHPHTGEADRFLAFVENEWVREVEGRYPASGKRIIVGHSFGGVFALHAFFTRPALFDAYIALGASAWVGDRVLFEEAARLFETNKPLTSFIYMAVGEGDGGPTTPSSRDLAEVFNASAPDSLEWTFSVTPQTDHFKNFASGMHEAFMALFPAWGYAEELRTRAAESGPAGVSQWFQEKEDRLGYRFKPAWFDLGNVAYGLAREHAAAGLAVMEHLRRHYPQNPYVASFSASVFERVGDFDRAESELLRAIEIARDEELDPNVIQIAGLEERLTRIRAARSASE